MTDDVSQRKLLEDCVQIRQECGKLNRSLIEENLPYPYERLHNHFDDLYEVRMYLMLANSSYIPHNIQDVCDLDSLREPMIELLEQCEKRHGK